MFEHGVEQQFAVGRAEAEQGAGGERGDGGASHWHAGQALLVGGVSTRAPPALTVTASVRSIDSSRSEVLLSSSSASKPKGVLSAPRSSVGSSRAIQARMGTKRALALPVKPQTPTFRVSEGMTEAQIADLEYQFRVVYTLDAVTKSRAHFQFVLPNSAEGKNIRNVLVQHKLADHLYPHKPGEVVSQIQQKTGKAFATHNHTQA